MANKVLDMVIVGGGAAGLTAAIYAQRAGLDYVMLDIAASMGSQLTQTDEVENYTGLGKIGGMDLVMKFREHAQSMGANMADGRVQSVVKDDGIFTVKTAQNSIVRSEYRVKRNLPERASATAQCATGSSIAAKRRWW